MRAVVARGRAVLALARAARSGSRACGLDAHSVAPRLQSVAQWRSLTSSSGGKPPANPFEIQLDLPEKGSGSPQTLSMVEVEHAAAKQKQEAEHDIQLLHEEMSNLFGEELLDYDADGQHAGENTSLEMPSNNASVPEKSNGTGSSKSLKAKKESTPAKDAPRKKTSPKSKTPASEGAKPHLLVVEGPCSFVGDHWVRGALDKNAHRHALSKAANQLGFNYKLRDENDEAKILNWLLEARPPTIVVLSWNTELSRSPHVVRALELITCRVIVVSPMGVEHGPLPPNVVGVLSGFGKQSLNLALEAAKKLTKQQ